MNNIKHELHLTKNKLHAHYTKHKVKYAVVATAATCYKISRQSVNQWNEFLEEKGLTDEFYHPVDEFGNEL